MDIQGKQATQKFVRVDKHYRESIITLIVHYVLLMYMYIVNSVHSFEGLLETPLSSFFLEILSFFWNATSLAWKPRLFPSLPCIVTKHSASPIQMVNHEVNNIFRYFNVTIVSFKAFIFISAFWYYGKFADVDHLFFISTVLNVTFCNHPAEIRDKITILKN